MHIDACQIVKEQIYKPDMNKVNVHMLNANRTFALRAYMAAMCSIPQTNEMISQFLGRKGAKLQRRLRALKRRARRVGSVGIGEGWFGWDRGRLVWLKAVPLDNCPISSRQTQRSQSNIVPTAVVFIADQDVRRKWYQKVSAPYLLRCKIIYMCICACVPCTRVQ